MLIKLNLNEMTVRELDELVNERYYPTWERAVEVAVHAWYLEFMDGKEGSSVVVPDLQKDDLQLVNLEQQLSAVDPLLAITPTIQNAIDNRHIARWPLFKIPDHKQIEYLGMGFAEKLSEKPRQLESIRPEDWVFEQHNAYLPVKCGLRALLNYAVPKFTVFLTVPEFMKACEEASKQALELAVDLEKRVKDKGAGFTNGFPSTPKSGPPRKRDVKLRNSRIRFEGGFIGWISKPNNQDERLPEIRNSFGNLLFEAKRTKEGDPIYSNITGFPVTYGFIGIGDGMNEDRIGLTEKGYEFASLHNPALDDSSDKKLSPEEIDFLLEHIKRHVPEEVHAFGTILGHIEDDHNTPTKLKKLWEIDNSPNRIPQNKTIPERKSGGVLARMGELELFEKTLELSEISRRKEVTYSLTESGKQFLGEVRRR